MWHNINIGKKKNQENIGEKGIAFPHPLFHIYLVTTTADMACTIKKTYKSAPHSIIFSKAFFFPLWVKVICSKDSFEGFGFITKIPVLLSTFLLLMVSEWGKGIHSTYLGHSSSLLTLSISLLRHENHFLKDCRLLSECYTDYSSL